uniref:Golgi to ER traffic protein 4 homolog n=1 Tax=Clastoptera arizonana TaxID=38151 RepID=A0A1B6C9S1_9HEMI
MDDKIQTRKSHGVQRVLEKLESSIKKGNYYEAHQMYRTLYFRYSTQKKYSELFQLLYDGAILLLKHDQQVSGCDLANLYAEVLVKTETAPSQELFFKISTLLEMISADVAEREVFLDNALRWSASGGQEYKNGHPLLHQAVAQVFWKEKNYVVARYHFLHSTDGVSFANMLIELHCARGFACEVDLFIAQVVLQYLCLQNKNTATLAFQSYTKHHPSINKGPPYLLPLLNFIWFLLKTIESGKLAAFTLLCEQYQGSIKRDPTYRDYLDKIAQIFFGVPPPHKAKNSGFLGNLFQSLMNGVDEFESDDDNSSTSARPSTSTQHMETEALD